jgi:hypothetical protein
LRFTYAWCSSTSTHLGPPLHNLCGLECPGEAVQAWTLMMPTVPFLINSLNLLGLIVSLLAESMEVVQVNLVDVIMLLLRKLIFTTVHSSTVATSHKWLLSTWNTTSPDIYQVWRFTTQFFRLHVEVIIV